MSREWHPPCAAARSALALALLLASGCVQSASLVLGDARYGANPADHPILVFDTIEDVPFPFTKVARVVASGANDAGWQRVLSALEAEARKVGADALVLGRGGEANTDLDAEGGMVMRRTLWALAIRRAAAKPAKVM